MCVAVWACIGIVMRLAAAEFTYNIPSIITQQPSTPIPCNPGTVDYTMYFLDACYAFSPCGRVEGLYQYLYGEVLTIGDIYLPARLASQGILTFASGYGTTSSEQYLAQLAITSVNFSGDYLEWGAILNVGYEIPLCWDVGLQIALDLPVRDIRKTTFLDFQGGRIMATSTITNPIDNASQYMSDFNGTVEDFFLEGILKPKGLVYIPVQHACGLGDPTAYFTFSRDLICSTTVYAGIGVTWPHTPKPTANIIDELLLGNGGATFIDLYAKLDYDACEWFLRPSVEVDVRLNPTFTTPIRSSHFISNYSQTVCYAPPTYQTAFTTEPFYELDSTVYQFADSSTCAAFKYGTQITFVFKNTFKLERQQCSFMIGYQFYHADPARITHPCNGIIYDDSSNPATKPVRANTMVWELSHAPSEIVQCNIGGFVVVTGQNTYRTVQFYAQLHWAFA